MRNYVNLAVPTMPLLVADKRGAAETKIIAAEGKEHAKHGEQEKTERSGHWLVNVFRIHDDSPQYCTTKRVQVKGICYCFFNDFCGKM
jgi:hypothetical protein